MVWLAACSGMLSRADTEPTISRPNSERLSKVSAPDIASRTTSFAILAVSKGNALLLIGLGRDLPVRLGLYRRIGALASDAETEAMAAELVDRFGKLPQEVEHLLSVMAHGCSSLMLVAD